MHTKLLHINPRFQVTISTPITDKGINKTLQGELINTVNNCSNSSNNYFFFNSQHKCFNMDNFIGKIKDKYLVQSRRKFNTHPHPSPPAPKVIIKNSS